MRFRTTAILFLLLLALCGGYIAMHRIEDAQDRRTAEAKRLFDFPASDLKAVTVDPIGEKQVVGVQFQPGAWRITEPSPDIQASNEVWNRLAENLAGLVNERALLGKVDDLSLYGLAEPILEVRGEVVSGEFIDLRFGDLEPTQTFRYALRDGESLFLVNGAQFHELNRKLDLLRHAFLVDNRKASLLRVEIAHILQGNEPEEVRKDRAIGDESPPLILQRDTADAPWRMIAPIEAAADQDKAEQLAAEIQGGVGRGFIDAPEHLSDYGLAPARMRITVVDDQEGKPQTVLIGDLDEAGQAGLFVKRADRPAVFLIEPHLLTLIPRAPLDLRDRRMLTRPVADAVRIEYERSASRFTIERDPERGWGVTTPPLHDVEQAAISRFLSSLKNVQAQNFVEGAQADFGLDRPEVRIQIAYAEGIAPMAVRIGKRSDPATGDQYFAVQQDSGDVMLVTPNLVQPLLLDPTDLRSRRLFDFDRHGAEVLDLTFEGIQYRFEKVHGVWQVRAPENAAITNQSDVERILDQLSRLEAVGIERADTGDDTRYGLATPLLTAQATIADAAGTRTNHGPIRVGGLVADSLVERYARVAGRQGVFRVHQDLVTGIRAALGGIALPTAN